MKKMKNLFMLLAIFFMLPVVTHAQDGNVSISSITNDSKSTGVIENAEPTFSGLSVNFDVKFTNVGDSIVYKVDIVNKDNEDYTLENTNISDDPYITYDFSFSDKSNVLKANSTKTMYITMKYAKEVPESALVNGKYTNNSSVKINFTDKDGNSVVNPKTGSSVLLIIILMAIVIFGVALVLFKNNKGIKTMSILVATALIVIPTSIFALKSITINVNTNIEISDLPEFCVFDFSKYDEDQAQVSSIDQYYLSYQYIDGMTFGDYFTTFKDTNLSSDSQINVFYTYEDLRRAYEVEDNADYPGTVINADSVIKNKDEGCYIIELENSGGQK